MNAVIVWFVIGVACLAGELFTTSFVLFFFGVGAWAAALVAAVHSGLEQELIAFLLVSLTSLLFLRRRLVAVFRGSKADAPSARPGVSPDGAPEFVHTGALAEVTQDIPAGGIGEIALGGSFWRAFSPVTVARGTRVRVKGPSPADMLVLEVETAE